MQWNKDSTQAPVPCGSIQHVDQAGAEIIINVGEDLDLRLSDTFLQAVSCAQRDVTSRIVVDLSKTRRIFDSGLAMLMLLNDRTWRLSGKIRIINCRPELKHRLSRGLIPGMFNLVQGCQE
jgi:anti-anti-sigma regulatory factor